jgi:hypothetical protein
MLSIVSNSLAGLVLLSRAEVIATMGLLVVGVASLVLLRALERTEEVSPSRAPSDPTFKKAA